MSDERRNSSTRVSMRRGSKSQTPPAPLSIKCITVGDGDVGKSTMLLTYLCGHCPSDISPGPMDGLSEYDHLTQFPTKLTVDTTEVNITLIDSYGLDEYEKLRERLCASGDVYILCYDVSRPSTFDRISHHWLPEIRRYAAPDTPFIVAGLKTDIRSAKADDPSADAPVCISYTQGLKASREIGAFEYVECSSKTYPQGVRRVVGKAAHAAISAATNSSELKRSSCSVS